MSGPTLTVNLDAITRNLGIVRSIWPGLDVVPVLKADAYGLGAGEVGRFLFGAGVRRFWVETLDEGLSLRKSLDGYLPRGRSEGRVPVDRGLSPRPFGYGASIGVLDGPPPGEVGTFLEYDLEAAVCDAAQMREWMRGTETGAGSCVLAVDTGFNRLGFHPDDPLASEPGSLRALGPRAWMTHVADGGAGPGSPRNSAQAESIRRYARMLVPIFPAGLPLSLGFDGAIAMREMIEPAEIRSGAALFGVKVFPGLLPLENVVKLDAPVLRVLEVPAGGRVGYGSGWEARRPSRVAVLGIGYAHGVPRSLAGAVRFGAANSIPPAPIVGAISMELLACDVTDLPERATAPGNRGRLLDERYGINEMARDSDRLDTEILCTLGSCPKDYLRSSL